MRKWIGFISIILILSSCNSDSNKKDTESEPELAPIETKTDTVAENNFEEKKEVEEIPKPEIILEKELTYDKYTLEDVYPYKGATRKDTVRYFQFDSIRGKLEYIEELRSQHNAQWGILQNRRGSNGVPPLPKVHKKNAYKVEADKYGIEQAQAIPLYLKDSLKVPERYALDGSLVRITSEENDFVIAETTSFPGEFYIPQKYVRYLKDTLEFKYVVFVDRKNQNISTYERTDSVWKIRSMNPCTTGAHHPPYQKETPLGLFMLQDKLDKMYYYDDGTTDIGGYAPWANRFCQGGYIHGIPVNKPQTKIIEYSSTLGTIPRSHMCVRNVSSHSKYIYDNFPAYQTLVYVIE